MRPTQLAVLGLAERECSPLPSGPWSPVITGVYLSTSRSPPKPHMAVSGVSFQSDKGWDGLDGVQIYPSLSHKELKKKQKNTTTQESGQKLGCFSPWTLPGLWEVREGLQLRPGSSLSSLLLPGAHARTPEEDLPGARDSGKEETRQPRPQGPKGTGLWPWARTGGPMPAPSGNFQSLLAGAPHVHSAP